MNEGQGKTALVTGASSGIGKAFAELLAEKGYALVLTARRRDRLDALAAALRQRHGIETHTIVADLAEPDASSRIVAELQQRRLTIDFLVNNAGYGVPGSYVNVAWPDHARFMQVMVTAVLDLTYRLFPAMLERGWGRIINIASVAGMVPAPAGHTLYGASKAFLIRFSEALSAEGAPKGVHVTAVCPGFTLQRIPRRHRHARQDEQDAGYTLARRAVGGARGLRRRDAGPLRWSSTAGSTDSWCG